jgi:hypothetical protein
MAWMALAACNRVPEPEGQEVKEGEKKINVESVLRLLDQNDVRIDLPGEGSWEVESEAVSSPEVISVWEQSGQEYPLVAVVRFFAKGYEVHGWIRYKQSTAFEGALKRAETDWWKTVRVRKR